MADLAQTAGRLPSPKEKTLTDKTQGNSSKLKLGGGFEKSSAAALQNLFVKLTRE